MKRKKNASEQGATLMVLVLSLGAFAFVALAGGKYLSMFSSSVREISQRGTMKDIDSYLRRRIDCKKTIATYAQFCGSPTKKPLSEVRDPGCAGFSGNADTLLTAALGPAFISGYQVYCKKSTGNPNDNRFRIIAEVTLIGNPTPQELFQPPLECEVDLVPPTYLFSDGFSAANIIDGIIASPKLQTQHLPGCNSGSQFPQKAQVCVGTFVADHTTLTKVCNLVGYQSYVTAPTPEDFTSCGNNSAFQWSTALGSFEVIHACPINSSLWHWDSMTCTNPIGGTAAACAP